MSPFGKLTSTGTSMNPRPASPSVSIHLSSLVEIGIPGSSLLHGSSSNMLSAGVSKSGSGMKTTSSKGTALLSVVNIF